MKLTYSLNCFDRIKHTYILDDPFDDQSQLTELIPDPSPEGKPKDEVIMDVTCYYLRGTGIAFWFR